MPISEKLRKRFLRTARFLPYRREGPGTWPSPIVAGAKVFVYVDKDGHPQVGVDLDTTHPALIERPRTRSAVPLHITIQDTTVSYEPAERAGHCAWAVLRADGGLTLYAGDWQAAECAATRLGLALLRRRAGERVWEMVADYGEPTEFADLQGRGPRRVDFPC